MEIFLSNFHNGYNDIRKKEQNASITAANNYSLFFNSSWNKQNEGQFDTNSSHSYNVQKIFFIVQDYDNTPYQSYIKCFTHTLSISNSLSYINQNEQQTCDLHHDCLLYEGSEGSIYKIRMCYSNFLRSQKQCENKAKSIFFYMYFKNIPTPTSTKINTI